MISLRNNVINTSLLFFKFKKEFIYIFLFISIIISILFSLNQKNQLYAFNNGNYQGILILFIPVFILLIFYDVVSGLYESGSIKRLMIEPYFNRNIMLTLIINSILLSILISASFILPMFIITNFTEHSFNSEIKLLFIIIILFDYSLFWSFLAVLFTLLYKRSIFSLVSSFLSVIFLILVIPSLLNKINKYFIFKIFYIGVNSPLKGFIVNFELYLFPDFINNSIYPLIDKHYISYSFKHGEFDSFTKIASLNLSIKNSSFFLIPDIMYSIFIIMIIFFLIRRYNKKF